MTDAVILNTLNTQWVSVVFFFCFSCLVVVYFPVP